MMSISVSAEPPLLQSLGMHVSADCVFNVPYQDMLIFEWRHAERSIRQFPSSHAAAVSVFAIKKICEHFVQSK